MANTKLPTGIFPNKDSITIRFAVKGKRFTETLRIPPTQRNINTVAVKKRVEMIAKVETQGGLEDEVLPTMGDYLKKWLTLSKRTVAANTHIIYGKTVTRLVANLGDVPVDKMTVGIVRDFCHQLGDVKPKTIANNISPLRLALAVAVDDGVIPNNVLADWSFKTFEEDNRKEYVVDPITADEQKAILAEMQPQIRNFYQLSMWSGIRTSEAVALTWGDVDFDKGTISINKTRTQLVNHVVHQTKTSASKRVIKLLKPALDAIKDQRQYTQLRGEEVFLHPEMDEPFRGDRVLRKTFWNPAIKKAGVKYRNPYQCRHTFASMMLSTGENPRWIATYMGHTDWTMIARVYGKWMPEVESNAGNKAVEMFG